MNIPNYLVGGVLVPNYLYVTNSGVGNWYNILNYQSPNDPSNDFHNTLTTGSLGCTSVNSNVFKLILNGTFIVDEPIAFQYSEILMGQNAKIIVKTGKQLTLSCCHIYSCDDYLWDRIEVEDGARLVIESINSEIQDAYCAVYAKNNAQIEISQTKFNRNLVGIEIEGPSLNTNSFINSSCSFTCLGSPYHPTSNPILPSSAFLKAPLTSVRSSIGIKINNLSAASNLTISPPSNSNTDYCYFRNLDYGIKAFDSKFKVFNSKFIDINNPLKPTGPDLVGTAIYIQGTSLLTNTSDVEVGNFNSNGLFKKCTFQNCKRGIYVTKSTSLITRGNSFSNTTFICIDQINNSNRSIQIEGNTFTTFGNACRLRNCINSPAISLNSNQFFGPPVLPTSISKDYSISAIVMINTPIGNTKATISENTFNDVRVGVFGSMVDEINLMSNQVHFTREFIDLNNQQHAGFWFEGSNRITAQYNTVNYTNFPSVPPAQLNTFKTLMRGFNLKALTNSTIRDNLVSACGTSMRLIDDCNFTYLNCNTFNACARGLHFQNLILPQQGGVTGAAGNYWTNFNPSVDRVSGNLGILTKYYHLGTSIETPTPFNCPGFAPIPTNSQALCQIELSDPNIDISRIDDIINEANSFSNEEVIIREKERIDAFLMLIDSIALYPEYQYWIDSISNTSTGFYSKLIAENEDRNDIRNALSQINTFEDTRLMEKKNLYVLALSEQLGDSTVSYDSLALENLANTNAWDGTSAVFLARGILGIEVDDEEIGLRLADNMENKNCSIHATLQGDFLSLLGESKYVIDMYDAMGRKIESLETQNSMNINTSTYKQKGVQLISISNSDCQKVIKLP